MKNELDFTKKLEEAKTFIENIEEIEGLRIFTVRVDRHYKTGEITTVLFVGIRDAWIKKEFEERAAKTEVKRKEGGSFTTYIMHNGIQITHWENAKGE